MRSGSFDRFNNSSEGVRIPVFHERTNGDNSTKENEESETSSVGSASSRQRSGSGSSGSGIYNSSSFDGKSQENSSSPRVHHIPIRIEGRDDLLRSNTPDSFNVHRGDNLSRSSSGSSQKSANLNGRSPSGDKLNSANFNSSSPPVSPPTIPTKPKPVSRSIPIHINSDAKPVHVVNNVKPKAAGIDQPSHGKPKKSQGPFVTRIPVSQPDQKSPNDDDSEPVSCKEKVDTLKLIEEILVDFKKLNGEIEKFDGTQKDKNYLFLDEMLTRCMIKLDNIDTEGKEELRKARKEAIREVEKCITLLESKVKSRKPVEQDVQMEEGQEEVPQTQNDDGNNVDSMQVDQHPTDKQETGEKQRQENVEAKTEEKKEQNESEEKRNDQQKKDDANNEKVEKMEEDNPQNVKSS